MGFSASRKGPHTPILGNLLPIRGLSRGSCCCQARSSFFVLGSFADLPEKISTKEGQEMSYNLSEHR